MNDTYDAINSIGILSVVEKLGLKTKKLSEDVYGIMEGDILTSGWRINVKGRYINDFSHDRARGNNFSLVKHLRKLTDRDTFLRFEQTFGIASENSNLVKKNASLLDLQSRLGMTDILFLIFNSNAKLYSRR